MKDTIVITGIGVASPHYVGSDVLVFLDKEKETNTSVVAIENLESKLEEFIPYKQIRRMCRFSQLALYSNILCKENSKIQFDGEYENVGSIMNTSYGPLNVTESFLEKLIQSGPQAVSPMDFSNTVNNCATGQVSISMKLKGVSTTLIGSSAVSYAFDLLQHGKANAILVSGVEEYEVHLDQVAKEKGFDMKEQSMCILMETKSHALARQADIYSEITECSSFYLNDKNASWIYENKIKPYLNGTVYYINSCLESRKLDELILANESVKLLQNKDVIFGATEVKNCLCASGVLALDPSDRGDDYEVKDNNIVSISIQQNGSGSIVVQRRAD